jgi:hypothetical protein
VVDSEDNILDEELNNTLYNPETGEYRLFVQCVENGNWVLADTVEWTKGDEEDCPIVCCNRFPEGSSVQLTFEASGLFGILNGTWVLPLERWDGVASCGNVIGNANLEAGQILGPCPDEPEITSGVLIYDGLTRTIFDPDCVWPVKIWAIPAYCEVNFAILSGDAGYLTAGIVWRIFSRGLREPWGGDNWQCSAFDLNSPATGVRFSWTAGKFARCPSSMSASATAPPLPVGATSGCYLVFTPPVTFSGSARVLPP